MYADDGNLVLSLLIQTRLTNMHLLLGGCMLQACWLWGVQMAALVCLTWPHPRHMCMACAMRDQSPTWPGCYHTPLPGP
jgi:hypothetical protein